MTALKHIVLIRQHILLNEPTYFSQIFFFLPTVAMQTSVFFESRNENMSDFGYLC